jgi:hypothetical protein
MGLWFIDKESTMKRTACRILLLSLGLWASALILPRSQAADRIEYNRDVRPILSENCFACHGPDSASRKAGLRLDRRDEAIKSEALVPGKPDQSPLVERIFSANPKKLMPPAKSHKTLTDAQKDILKRWVAQGAEYQLHWSLIAPQRPELPAVKNTAWVRNPVDRFILAELEKRGLQPAPEADRRTLARRLSFDLTGLPPEPADVEAFVSDPSMNAYEKYVEKLLKSPHWGEHRGRYWLDASRYADSNGIHFDNFREIWAYRDWVINAFNSNMPFDQFTLEQIAGDLLPDATLDQKIATGFNRCNITTNEGGAINEEYLVLYTRDRTETVSQVWMGLTTGCAVCHDHKFDPISTRDFYSLSAFFNNTTQGAMDGNIKDTPPILTVPRTEDRPRWNTVIHEIAAIRKQADERKKTARPEFDKWLATAKPDESAGQVPTSGLRFHAPLTEGDGNKFNVSVDGKLRALTLDSGFEWGSGGKRSAKAFILRPGSSLELPDAGDFEKDQGFSAAAWVQITKRGGSGAILSRMDNANGYRGWDFWVQNERIGTHIINKWQDDALKVVAKQPLKTGEWHHVLVTYDGSAKAAGVKVYYDGVLQETEVEADALKSTIRTKVPFKIGQRNTSERLQNIDLQDLRVYDRTLSLAEAGQLAKSSRINELLGRPEGKRTVAETNELFDWWLSTSDQPARDLATKLAALQQEEAGLRSRGTVAHVMSERNTEPGAFILYRGDYDKRRDPVKAATPKVLPPMSDDLPRNRLGFAKWLLRPEHPLTARVTVNRLWQELFGTGLVRTAGDFGVTGEAPSHPELLDWLAVEFRESGWDTKKFFTMLVTSAAYRQAAITTPEKREKDAQNRYLSRGTRYRLDAETVRDNALAVSGLLVQKVGGPSVKPYQPDGVWEAVAMIGSNTRDYKRDAGENLYRRSMYTFWKRSAPPASMEIFNAPNRETCTVRRERTNTPLQALVTLNDPQFVEAARVLAQRALKDGGATDEARLDFIARRLISRPFREEESKVVQNGLSELLAHYKSKPEEAKKLIVVGESKPDATLDPATLAAWTMMVNELLNLDEVLNK